MKNVKNAISSAKTVKPCNFYIPEGAKLYNFYMVANEFFRVCKFVKIAISQFYLKKTSTLYLSSATLSVSNAIITATGVNIIFPVEASDIRFPNMFKRK